MRVFGVGTVFDREWAHPRTIMIKNLSGAYHERYSYKNDPK